MGQYYRGVILKKDFRNSFKDEEAEVILSPYDYNNGAKLMEHSYIGNYYLKPYEHLLANQFYGYPFVWCGDYANDIRCYIENLTEVEFSEKYDEEKKWYIPHYFKGIITNITINKTKQHRYILNLSKKQYVDMQNLKNGKDGLCVHPLSLLCASGNLRGGGDYFGVEKEKVGVWAYDNIGIGDEVPEDFTEFVTNFETGW